MAVLMKLVIILKFSLFRFSYQTFTTTISDRAVSVSTAMLTDLSELNANLSSLTFYKHALAFSSSNVYLQLHVVLKVYHYASCQQYI